MQTKNKKITKITKISITLVAILVAIIVFSNIVNPFKTKINSKSEAMESEEILNVGRNGYITEAVITKRLTGTGPFDEDDLPGNDSSETNDIVRSFDQITWTIENTMKQRDGTIKKGLKGGRLKLEAELPASTANVVKWDLDSMQWASDATVSEDGRTLVCYYDMEEDKVTIPGKQTLVPILKVLGATNGTEIKPTFKISVVGNSEGEEKTVPTTTVKVSAKPSYNVELIQKNGQNIHLYKEIDLEENGTTTKGKLYGYFLGLQLYNGDNPDKGMKGIEQPKGDITFDLDLKMERVDNGDDNVTDITTQAMPILYNYALNESTNTDGNIPGRPMNGHTVYSHYMYWKPANNGHGLSDSVYDSGTIRMVQQGNKVHVTLKDYQFNGNFPKTRYRNVTITNNIGYFGAYYFQVLVPYTEATLADDNTYYLSVTDENFSATSLGGTAVSEQALDNDDVEKCLFVRYPPGSYSDVNWLTNTVWDYNQYLHTAWDQGDGRGGIGQVFKAKTGVASNENNSEKDTIYDSSSLLKWDGNIFEISEIDGKVWNVEKYTGYTSLYQNEGEMDFQMLYAAKKR